MKNSATVVVRRGQITIPVEIRGALGIKDGDKVSIILAGGHARLVPGEGVTAQTTGMFWNGRPPLSLGEENRAFEQAVTQESVDSEARVTEEHMLPLPSRPRPRRDRRQRAAPLPRRQRRPRLLQ